MKGIALLALACASCSWLDGELTRPAREAPVPAAESYLQGGPNTEVELGSDERTLLADYKRLSDAKIQIETKLAEVQAENEQLRSQLRRAEEERDQSKNLEAGSTRELERLGARSRDLEAKVLSVQIEKTKLEQELLRLRITGLREQLEQMTSLPDDAAAPAPGARR
jgi:hypothetical protein